MFGEGLSVLEWESLTASPWRRRGGVWVRTMPGPAGADLLALHGPFTTANWPFFLRWYSARAPHAKVVVVGPEAPVRDGFLLGPEGLSRVKVDLVVPGEPPTPRALKEAVLGLFGEAAHV